MDDIDGEGNQMLLIHGRRPSTSPVGIIVLLDSHGQLPSKVKDPDYHWITQSQIDWFTATVRGLKSRLEGITEPVSMVFQHIPLPEFGHPNLKLRAGQRREPTEGPSFNSGFYRALVNEGVTAVACGHDHVNDFCARPDPENESEMQMPWLCYGGSAGFGAYGSYGGQHVHRRMRIWELDGNRQSLKTWKHVEYSDERIDEIILKEGA
jgi:hypothetical protein